MPQNYKIPFYNSVDKLEAGFVKEQVKIISVNVIQPI